MSSDIFTYFKKRNSSVQEAFFKKEATVLALFRNFNEIEQMIILKKLFHTSNTLFLKDKKREKAIKNL